jgi:hypothetical protein
MLRAIVWTLFFILLVLVVVTGLADVWSTL